MQLLDLNDYKLTLALDRTNWKYGKKDINLLVLSVCVLDCSLRSYRLELDSRGNSNTKEQIELLEQFIAQFVSARIDYLAADREFIGNDWFKYLDDNGISFIVRIKSNMLLKHNGIEVGAGKLFKQVTQGSMISY